MKPPISFDPTGIPAEMRAFNAWVLWKLEPVTKDGNPILDADGNPKMAKVPYNPHTGGKAASTRPAEWATFDVALHALKSAPDDYAGMGFVFSADDPLVFCDLDHHLDKNRVPSEIAQEAIDRAQSWAEVSQSGTGLHIIVRGRIPGKGNRKKVTGGEMYTTGRFVAMTGNHFPGTPLTVAENQEFLDWFYTRFVLGIPDVKAEPDQTAASPPPVKNGTSADWLAQIPLVKEGEPPVTPIEAARPVSTPPRAAVEVTTPTLDDEALLIRARNQDGGRGEKFRALYDEGQGDLDDSEAAQSLCNTLAFWVGPDPERISRLFRGSKLYLLYPDKAKWNRTSRDYTIPNACEYVKEKGWFEDGRNGQGNGHADVPDDVAALDRRLLSESLTDAGNARRLIARYGADLRYCATEGAWYVWNGKVWEKQRDLGAVARFALATAKAIRREARAIPEVPGTVDPATGTAKDKNQGWRDLLFSHAKFSEGKVALSHMIAVAAWDEHQQITVSPSDFDRHPLLLPVENFTLDLQNWKVYPHDRSRLLTNWMPVTYDKTAVAPQWDAFLTRILPDPDVRRYVQTFLGYCLTGLTGEQVCLFLYGSGANGKGVLMDTLAAIWGRLHARIRSEVIMSTATATGEARFGLASIMGRRLVTFGELEARSAFNEARLKELTGEDMLEIEQKGKQPFNYQHFAKFILAGNHRPTIRGTDEGVWRRVRMIPCEVTIPLAERDPGLRSKLMTEASGILSWLLIGLKNYQKEGLCTPAAVLAATKEYQEDSDTLGQFLNDCCDLGPGLTSSGGGLYAAYKWFMKDTSQERFALSGVKFPQYLSERGFRKTKTMTGVLWQGLSVKQVVEKNVESQGPTSPFDTPGWKRLHSPA